MLSQLSYTPEITITIACNGLFKRFIPTEAFDDPNFKRALATIRPYGIPIV